MHFEITCLTNIEKLKWHKCFALLNVMWWIQRKFSMSLTTCCSTKLDYINFKHWMFLLEKKVFFRRLYLNKSEIISLFTSNLSLFYYFMLECMRTIPRADFNVGLLDHCLSTLFNNGFWCNCEQLYFVFILLCHFVKIRTRFDWHCWPCEPCYMVYIPFGVPKQVGP